MSYSDYDGETLDGEQPWQDKELLEEYYVRRDHNMHEMADIFGCSPGTISNWINKLGIEAEKPANERCTYPELQDEEWVRDKYLGEGLTAYDIADELGCSRGAVQRAVNRFGIKPHSKGYGMRTRHPTFDSQKGYERATSHLFRDGEQIETKSVRIHRLIMVAEHGFDAVIGKHVHHKNGVPWDNRPENLELMTNSEHRTHHNNRPEGCWDRDPYN